MSPDSLLLVLWRRRVLLLTTFVLALIAVGLGTALLPKAYSSTSYIRVSATASGSDYESTQVNLVVLRTYAELLQSRQIVEAVGADPTIGLTPDEVQRAVTITPVDQSQLIAIQSTGPSPAEARVLATTYATVGIGLTSAKAEATGASSAVLVQPGAEDPQPTWPRPTLTLLVGGLLVAVLAIVVALVADRVDPRVGRARVDHLVGLPVLGRFSRSGVTDEDWRRTTSRLVLARNRALPASIAVVCVGNVKDIAPHCLQLARMVSEYGRQVAVIDTDILGVVERQSTELGPRRGPGLADYLSNPPGQLRHLMQPTVWPRLTVVQPGAAQEALPLLMSSALPRLESELRTNDVIGIYLTPPLTAGPDALVVAGVAELTLLVVDEQAQRRDVEAASADIARAGGRTAGVVIVAASSSEHGLLPARGGKKETGSTATSREKKAAKQHRVTKSAKQPA